MTNRKPFLAALAITIAAQACLRSTKRGVAKTVDEDPSLPSIAIAGTRFHAEAFGDPNAPMIMVLHGGPGGDYRSLLPMRALADDGYYVVFWDQRGAGLSRRHARSSYAMSSYLEDLRLVIEHYSASSKQPIIFIGHSWGAMYATWFINEYGDYNGRIRGAILSEPGAFTKAQLDVFLDEIMAAMPIVAERFNDILWTRQFMTAADHARADYLSGLRSFGGVPSEMHDPEKPEPTWRAGAVVNAKLFSFAQDGFDWTTRLRDYGRPVLFLRGEHGLPQQQELASHYATAELITVRGVGHEGIWERSDEFLAHIRRYLAKVDQRSGSSASR